MIELYEQYIDLSIAYAIKAFGALLIFVVGKIAARWLQKFADRAMAKYYIDDTLRKFGSNGIYYGLLIVVIMAALGQLGIETSSFLAIMGAAGLVIGLALKDTLSHVGAAIVILVFRPFRIGDVIEAGGASGTVESISLFSTTLISADNSTIVVPNSSIIAKNIINFSNKPIRMIEHTVGIGYNDDIKKAKDVMYGVIFNDPRTLDDPEPLVAVADLGDSSVNFTVRAWVSSDVYWNANFSLIEEIKIALDANEITIPYPQMDIHLEPDTKNINNGGI